MHVRIDQAGKNILVTDVYNVRAFHRPVKRTDRGDPAISDFERRRIDAARKDNSP
jgi:hypothetical protein